MMIKLKSVTHVLLTLSVALAAQTAIADNHSQEADQKPTRVNGEVFYAHGDQIARRPLMLTMTRNAAGEPVFMLQSGKQVLTATAAFMHDANNGREAYLFFKDAWRVNGGQLKHLLLKGWKIGTGASTLFYGSAFLTTDTLLADNGETLESCIEAMRTEHGEVDAAWLHAGGFKFVR